MGDLPVAPDPAALPWWWALLLPVLLGAATWAAVAWDTALSARASGGRAGGGALTAPLREAARLLVGQRRRTVAADSVLGRIGGGVLPVAALLAAAVLPLGERPVADLSVGVVWFNAMEVLAWAAVWMVGWGSNSALGLVGGYRFVAQGLAYELPHMFAIITAALGAESLRLATIVDAQRDLWFVVIMPVAFVVYLMSAAAMAFWGPFDAPVARDVAGGAAAELSGVDRLVFARRPVAAARRGRGDGGAALPRRRARDRCCRRGRGWRSRPRPCWRCWCGCATGSRPCGWTATSSSPGSC